MVDLKWDEEGRGIAVWRADSAHEFIETLRRSQPHWCENSNVPWIFRGHADEGWPLLPAAWRNGNPIIAASKKEAALRFDRVKPQQSLHWALLPNFVTGATKFGQEDALKYKSASR